MTAVALSAVDITIDVAALAIIGASLYFVLRQEPSRYPYVKGLLSLFDVIYLVVLGIEILRDLVQSPSFVEDYASISPVLIMWSVVVLTLVAYSVYAKPGGRGAQSRLRTVFTKWPHGAILTAFGLFVLGSSVYTVAERPYSVVLLTSIDGVSVYHAAFSQTLLGLSLAVLVFFLVYPTALIVRARIATSDRGIRRSLVLLPVFWAGIGASLLVFEGYLPSIGYDTTGGGFVVLSLLFGGTALVFRKTSLLYGFFEPINLEGQAPSPGESEPLDVYAPILLLVDPSASFEKTLGNVAKEKVAAGNLVYVFTSKGSPLHYGMRGIPGVRFYLFTNSVAYPSPSDKSNELLVPQNDTSVILDLLDKTVSTTRKAPITIIFDSISDMALLLGTGDTYKFLKQAEQILVPRNLTSIYLLTAGAQDERTLNLVKSLFRLHAVLDQQGIRTTKGSELEGQGAGNSDQ